MRVIVARQLKKFEIENPLNVTQSLKISANQMQTNLLCDQPDLRTMEGKLACLARTKTVKVDTNWQRLSENVIKLVSIGTEREQTHRSETDRISRKTPDLTGIVTSTARMA